LVRGEEEGSATGGYSGAREGEVRGGEGGREVRAGFWFCFLEGILYIRWVESCWVFEAGLRSDGMV